MNQGYTYRERIDRRAAGRVLLDYLADRYRHASRQGWREHLAAGRVTLDAAVADGSEVLRKKQRLHYARAPWVEPVAPLEFAVLADGPG